MAKSKKAITSPSPPSGNPIDPYQLWAEQTNYRYYKLAKDDWVAVLIECSENVEALAAAVNKFNWINIPSCYTPPNPNPNPNPKHFSAKELTFCTATVAKSQLGSLRPLVKRFELGVAVANYQERGEIAPMAIQGGLVIGLIDDFVGFSHPDLAYANAPGKSRVHYVWNQDAEQPVTWLPSNKSNWRPSTGMPYGYELSTTASPANLVKDYPKAQRSFVHGMHVASLVAGRFNHNRDLTNQGIGRASYSDAASNAPIIAVQFPKSTLQDTSGGAMGVQVLDGLHYILSRSNVNAKVVVNLSYGTYAGPHDGTSILEAAIDQLVFLKEGNLAVVVPAGNQAEARCHAHFDLDVGKKKTLKWQIPPDCWTPSFMEIWLPDGFDQTLGIKVTNPSGRESSVLKGSPIEVGQTYSSTDGNWGVYFKKQVSNGTKGTMVLVAIAPTSGKSKPAPHGVWQIDFAGPAKNPIKSVQVWVERNDAMAGYRQLGRQSFLLAYDYKKPNLRPGHPGDLPNCTTQRQGAINTIATGQSTISVGGYRQRSPRVAAYSGIGQNHRSIREGPDVVAVSEVNAALEGVRGSSLGNSGIFRMNGTSVATAQTTRQIANWYGSEPLDGTSFNELLIWLAKSTLPTPPPLPAERPKAPAMPINADLREGWGRFP